MIFVTYHIFSVVTAECDVKKFWGLSQLPETGADVRLEVVPPEKKKKEINFEKVTTSWIRYMW